MATFIGIDAFRGGWVAVYIGGGRDRFDYAETADRLLDVRYERAMIDIPIGLPEHGYRDCDLAARLVIGPSPFFGARWGVWDFESYDAANEHYRSVADTAISQQLWQLRAKLREVNLTMTPERQQRLLETHPELVFRRLNANRPLARKKSREGRSQRVELLKGQGVSRIEEWLGQRYGTGIGRDDLIDAGVCAVAARDSMDRLPRGEPPAHRGIRAEMWF